MDLTRLEEILKSQPAYRLKQANEAIFVRLADSWNQVSNLPKDLREVLEKDCPLNIEAKIFWAKDKTSAKAAITLNDGNIIESVLMHHADNHNTVCVSCAVGCLMNCQFCATGALGFKRNLKAEEIIQQVILFNRILKTESERVNNVVFMGMGEPFLNYDEVLAAIRLINDKDKFNIGARRISISTVGIIESINKLAKENLQVNLAISLHAPTDQLRNQIIPANHKYPIKNLLKAVSNYIKLTNRRVMIEYLMLQNFNDSPKDARELAKILKNNLHRLFFVNLIAYNPTGEFAPTTPKQIKSFKEILEKEGISVVQRYRFGLDIDGACGQLTGKNIII
jgi:23S rRNA (adenine2503-C2)-methyltransferase